MSIQQRTHLLLLRKLLNKILNFLFLIGSLDLDFLFTNIPFEETTDICANTHFRNTETAEGLSKIEFKELLPLATKESYFNFNGKLYKQVDVVAMGSPLGPILAYAFLVCLLYNCSSEQGLITTSGMLINSLSWLPNQNI